MNLPGGNDVLEFTDTSTVEAGTTFTGLGTVNNTDTGDMTIADGFDSTALILQNDGVLHLGASPGQIELAQFEQTGTGTLMIELAGTDPNAFDSLTADFNATLAGTLHVTLLGGFTPTLGDTFTILTGATGRFGMFSNEDLPPLGGNTEFTVNYTSNSVELEVIASLLSADFEEDGDVDNDDLANWEIGYGTIGTAVHMDGDADGDLDVDGFDFLIWQQQFTGALPLSSLATVPEPATDGLLFLTASAILTKGLRRGRNRWFANGRQVERESG